MGFQADSGSLVRHTDFMGDGNDLSPANDTFSLVGTPIAIDFGNIAYVARSDGEVHKFDAATGDFLGVLGILPGILFGPATAKVMYHPTNGVWLIIVGSAVAGLPVGGICISGGPGPGTVATAIGTMYGGIFSGGNSGSWDVDTQGNIWTYSTAFGGSQAHLAIIRKVVFTDDRHLIVASQTDFSTLYGWTHANGVLVYPQDQTLLLASDTGTGGALARVSPTDMSIIVSQTSGPFSLPFQCGLDGTFVGTGLLDFTKVDGLDLTIKQTANVFDFGFSNTLNWGWYDSTNNLLWVHLIGFNYVHLLDLDNPTPAGNVVLCDPFNGSTDCHAVSFPVPTAVAASPHGCYAVTTFAGGGGPGFIDFWKGNTHACTEGVWNWGLNFIPSQR